MGAVEDHDLPARRRRAVRAPEEIMGELLVSRLLEAGHLDTLWIGAADHVADHAVFAGGIEALQHDQQRALAFGVKPVLQPRQVFHLARNFRSVVVVALVLAFVAGVNIGEFDLAARRHQKFFLEIHRLSRWFSGRPCAPAPCCL